MLFIGDFWYIRGTFCKRLDCLEIKKTDRPFGPADNLTFGTNYTFILVAEPRQVLKWEGEEGMGMALAVLAWAVHLLQNCIR